MIFILLNYRKRNLLQGSFSGSSCMTLNISSKFHGKDVIPINSNDNFLIISKKEFDILSYIGN